MKVLIVKTMTPFLWDRTDQLAAHLEKGLLRAGHEAETLRIPFQKTPVKTVTPRMLMIRGFELWNVDRVISFGFPASLIRHPKKTLWIFHEEQQGVFDYDGENLESAATKDGLAGLIRNAMGQGFKESRRVFADSETTKERLIKLGCVDASVLSPPDDPESFSGWPHILEELLG